MMLKVTCVDFKAALSGADLKTKETGTYGVGWAMAGVAIDYYVMLEYTCAMRNRNVVTQYHRPKLTPRLNSS